MHAPKPPGLMAPDDWLTKTEAAKRLHLSERSLDRLVQAGAGPERAFRRRPGLRPEVRFNPQDVERIMETARLKPRVVLYDAAKEEPAAAEPLAAGTLMVRSPLAESAATLATLRGIEMSTAALLPLLGRTGAGAASASGLFLTLKEAAVYSGLSLAFLRSAIRTRRLPAIRDRALKVLRTDVVRFAQGLTAEGQQ